MAAGLRPGGGTQHKLAPPYQGAENRLEGHASSHPRWSGRVGGWGGEGSGLQGPVAALDLASSYCPR